MKNFLFGLLTLSFSVIANAQIPEWYTHEMNRLVGTWVADNTVYMNDQENDDAYAIEWRRGIGKKNLLGRLYGLKKGRLTNEYWQFIQYWDPAAKQAKVIQIATFGTKGEGYLEYRDSANTQLIQTFTNPNGTSWTSGHKTRIFDNYEISTSYQIDKQNNWKEQRTYTWYKQKESTKTEDKNYALYLTQIATAEALLQLNKISEARAYLESCASEYRDMEWHFLDKYLDQARQTITPPKPSALNAVCLSPDGKWLAVGTADSAILLYNFPDLKLIRTLHGHQGAVTSLDLIRDVK